MYEYTIRSCWYLVEVVSPENFTQDLHSKLIGQYKRPHLARHLDDIDMDDNLARW